MELLPYRIELDGFAEPVWLHHFCDIHRASSGCDVRQLHSDISKLKHAVEKGEKHLWIGGGDWANAINPKDKRYDAAAVAEAFRHHQGGTLFNEEVAALCADFRPIRDYGIGIGMGNHEASIAKYHEFNPARAVAEQLDLPYLGYSACIRLTIGAKKTSSSTNVIIYWHHGHGASTTKGGKLNMLVKKQTVVRNADIYLVGHLHDPVSCDDVVMEVSTSGSMKLKTRPIVSVMGRSYQKSHVTTKPQKPNQFNREHIVTTDYAEMHALQPGPIGHNGVRIKVTKPCTSKAARTGLYLELDKVNF